MDWSWLLAIWALAGISMLFEAAGKGGRNRGFRRRPAPSLPPVRVAAWKEFLGGAAICAAVALMLMPFFPT